MYKFKGHLSHEVMVNSLSFARNFAKFGDFKPLGDPIPSDFFAIAQDYEQDGALVPAQHIYQFIQNGGAASNLKGEAGGRLGAMVGSGDAFEHLKFLGSQFHRQVMDPVALFSMFGAGATYRLSRFGLGNLFGRWGRGGSFLSEAASLPAFAIEATSFPLYGRLGNLALGHKVRWDAESLRDEIRSSIFILGGLRLGNLGSAALFNKVHGIKSSLGMIAGLPTNLLRNRAFFNQFGMYTGIVGGHGLDQWAGDGPAMSPGMLLGSSLITLAHFNAAGALLHALTPGPYQSLARDLESRFRSRNPSVNSFLPKFQDLAGDFEFAPASGGPFSPLRFETKSSLTNPQLVLAENKGEGGARGKTELSRKESEDPVSASHRDLMERSDRILEQAGESIREYERATDGIKRFRVGNEGVAVRLLSPRGAFGGKLAKVFEQDLRRLFSGLERYRIAKVIPEEKGTVLVMENFDERGNAGNEIAVVRILNSRQRSPGYFRPGDIVDFLAQEKEKHARWSGPGGTFVTLLAAGSGLATLLIPEAAMASCEAVSEGTPSGLIRGLLGLGILGIFSGWSVKGRTSAIETKIRSYRGMIAGEDQSSKLFAAQKLREMAETGEPAALRTMMELALDRETPPWVTKEFLLNISLFAKFSLGKKGKGDPFAEMNLEHLKAESERDLTFLDFLIAMAHGSPSMASLVRSIDLSQFQASAQNNILVTHSIFKAATAKNPSAREILRTLNVPELIRSLEGDPRLHADQIQNDLLDILFYRLEFLDLDSTADYLAKYDTPYWNWIGRDHLARLVRLGNHAAQLEQENRRENL